MSQIKISKNYPKTPHRHIQTHGNFGDWNYEAKVSAQTLTQFTATNLDRDFIASVLIDLEKQNVVFNKPTTQVRDSYFIATHTDKKDPQNIKSQLQNDNTQSDPESNLFSNLPEPDLVSPDDNTVTASDIKEFSNINTNEPITVDNAISLEDEVQSIHFTVTTPAK